MLGIHHIVFSLHQSSEDLLWFWQQKSKQQYNLCCEKLCTNQEVQGSIVYSIKTKKQYIVPLCNKHAASENKLFIPQNFTLVEL